MVRISMLLPARGRPANLRESLVSVFDLAAQPDDVEVLVRFDDCDPHLAEEKAIIDCFGALKITVRVGPRVGYTGMHMMYNELGAAAKGAWLFYWNDDIEMLTDRWDDIISDAPDFSVQFPRRDVVTTTDYTVPVVGRSIYEALGATPAGPHLSLNAFNDAWISDFSAFAGTSVIRDDVVFRHHRLNDQTLREQDDGGKEWARFITPEQKAARRADMEAVLGNERWSGRFDGWNVEEVDHVGVDYIRLAAGERKAQGFRLRGRK